MVSLSSAVGDYSAALTLGRKMSKNQIVVMERGVTPRTMGVEERGEAPYGSLRGMAEPSVFGIGVSKSGRGRGCRAAAI
ncbi:MAG: hypothetical protein TU35_008590 [Thermoproteus sp. AZ2]|jgi:hypothetical protein|uniref:Uncharacterized protein n=1 Tax=Thermoproteus sp. AZ2 TaxID=1609232 RepID=A0ACC6V2V7_9CREN|nr:MAG: hypothetical protein TU35_08465 [Thermoproteus sp. AZ2]